MERFQGEKVSPQGPASRILVPGVGRTRNGPALRSTPHLAARHLYSRNLPHRNDIYRAAGFVAGRCRRRSAASLDLLRADRHAAAHELLAVGSFVEAACKPSTF